MILLDVEATGLIPSVMAPLAQHPHLMELFALKLDDATLEERGTLSFQCRPPISIPAEVTKITSLTDADLKEQAPFAAHYWALINFFLGEKMVVAHNAPYDLGVLAAELGRLDKLKNFPWPPVHVCTVELTQHLTGKYLKLTELYEHLLGRPLAQTHRADADVRALEEVVRALWAQGMWVTTPPS
jgi:DNA polymerase III epsilon subunit-like protein